MITERRITAAFRSRRPAGCVLFFLISVSVLLLSACDETGTTAAPATPTPTALAPAAPDPRVVEAHNRFGMLLLEQLLSDGDADDRNVVISPVSIALALSMAYNGAGGQTAEAMADAMQLSPLLRDGLSRAHINGSNLALLQALQGAGEVAGDGGTGDRDTGHGGAGAAAAVEENGSQVRLNIANGLWHRLDFRLNERFLEDMERSYRAAVEGLDFAQPESVQRINGWVSRATEGLIPSVVDQLDDDVVMLLINAVYFKGQWTTPFDREATRPMPFHLSDGNPIEVPMMYRAGRVAYYEDEDVQAVRLPYGDDERLAMYLFLPRSGKTVTDVARLLSSEGVSDLVSRFAPAHGQVMIPRLDVAYSARLKGALRALGMGVAFQGSAADFSPMLPEGSPRNVYMNDVIHRSVLKVDEEGTEAAAVTSIEFRVTSMPAYDFIFRADRPFVLAIRDDETEALLFAGAIVNPGAGS